MLGRERVGGGTPWRLLLFSVFVFGIMLVSYLGLRFGYKPFLESQIQGLDTEIQKLATLMPQAEREQLTKFYFQVVNLKSILEKHVIASKLIPFAERIAHKQARFKSFSFAGDKGTVSIQMNAATPEAFVQQIEMLRSAPEVTSFAMSGVGVDEGGTINFGVVLTLKPELFH